METKTNHKTSTGFINHHSLFIYNNARKKKCCLLLSDCEKIMSEENENDLPGSEPASYFDWSEARKTKPKDIKEDLNSKPLK